MNENVIIALLLLFHCHLRQCFLLHLFSHLHLHHHHYYYHHENGIFVLPIQKVEQLILGAIWFNLIHENSSIIFLLLKVLGGKGKPASKGSLSLMLA